MTIAYYIIVFSFVLLCVLLCSVILMQESKSMGLGASFGEDTGSSVFGTSTADVLKKITSTLALIFVVVCVVLSFWTATLGRSSTAKPSFEIEDFSE